MGKEKRDKFLVHNRVSEFDFLPERTYVMQNGIKAIPRLRTRDFQMLFISREQEVKRHLAMEENETFVDVGANVGSYSLMIANEYKDKGVKVIAIEAHPENYKALRRNIECNKFGNVIIAINKVISDYKGSVGLYERSHDGTRVDSELYSICSDQHIDTYNILHPGGKSLQVECDTLDNILSGHRADVVKIDIEGAEVLALRGATNLISKVRKIIVEIHGGNLEPVKEILESFDFKLEISPGDQYVVGTRASYLDN
jgi:FkbM family methyltransferase